MILKFCCDEQLSPALGDLSFGDDLENFIVKKIIPE